jgi:hypothetical protein
MRPEDCVVMTVTCPRCKTDQTIHVACNGAQRSAERIPCINCNDRFEVLSRIGLLAGRSLRRIARQTQAIFEWLHQT